MVHTHIANLITRDFPYDPTPCQLEFIKETAAFVAGSTDDAVLLVKGYAGTGKTTLISTLVKVLPQFKIKTVLLAPTGRAAKVLMQYSGHPAYTIHKKIYRQRSSSGFGDFVLDRNLASNTLFIVDEASMIGSESQDASLFGSGNLLGDLIHYVYNGRHCRLMLIGDTAQLPPVGISLSPALDPVILSKYNLNVREVILTDVIRQSAGSGILQNATGIRALLDQDNIQMPTLYSEGFSDVIRISGPVVMEEISSAYQKYGLGETIVICRSNKQSNRYNNGIRRYILSRDEEISSGDYLMVVKNNYYWMTNSEIADFIANGDIIRIKRIRHYQERYGYRFADITAAFPDYNDVELDIKIMLDTLNMETASLPMEKNKDIFHLILEDYSDIQPKKKQLEKIKEDPFFNALQVKFAYAVTCHKAQGGQWPAIFIDQGFAGDPDREYLRWLYTAITRAKEKVYLINFDDKFF